MKYCINCGAQIKDEAKFCPNCGQDQTKEVDNEQQTESFTEKEAVKQSLAIGKSYFGYFMEKLRRPNADLTGNLTYFGYISLGIYLLLQALLTTMVISRGLSAIDQFFGLIGAYDYGYDPFSFNESLGGSLGITFFLRILFFYVLILVITIGITYGVERLSLKSPVSFNQTVNQLANFLSGINLFLLLFTFGLFIRLFSPIFCLIIMLLAVLFFQSSIIFVVQRNADNKQAKIAPFYIVLLVFVLNSIVNWFLTIATIG
ncbi:zinc ribbon domain-containing protein [Tetragenococcus halophilus]|uniref:Zinc-ribbon domain-containing protein n=3 Tax=Tetragenococcus halophilus TaxID=51669 RepID=A0A2H6DBP2_TETHA|nr:zinc ribbon domain-containing protein [Tetragenococcus halophilus]MDN6270310.1 zinc ribbon domain-containing protein [Tetragenococcus koreensis]AOF48390.1 hypothetical protein AC806_02660 [Tetragenococcus halophilus]AYW49846.1 zinc ribbon domain-containing protein [Tetragenococcus halophilus]MCF1675399.1 zinc ribbon domain-containing protein [Tetragenococcus halophilus]MCF1685104.1 zinc ribbon domain-containing protein [Tetragenococcus halophilus]